MTRVLVAGAGVAAVECVLALRDLAGPQVEIELLAPAAELVHRPSSVQTPFGAVCPTCSSVGTSFTCPRCMTAQLLLMPGTQPSALYGRGQAYAPVVKASPNASESKLKPLFEALAPLVGEVAKAAFGQNSSGVGSPWQQSAGYPW